jgi:cytochrome b
VTDVTANSRLVWDLPVRATHWLLVLAVTGSLVTHYAGIEWFAWHRRCGYVVVVLAAFRVVWGFAGTRHARFASFVRGPRSVLAYLRARGGAAVGHSPLGALSVVALLAALLLQAATGLFANDGIMNAGPFYGWISPELSNAIASVHRVNSKVLIALVVAHLAAVAWYALARRQRLARAMLTGRKDASLVSPGEEIDDSRTLRALAIVVALAGALALAVSAAPDAMIALY